MNTTRTGLSSAARAECRDLIQRALVEDLGSADSGRQRDITSSSVVPDQASGSASFVARDQGVVCGVEVCELVLEIAGRHVQMEVRLTDGQPVAAGQVIARLLGNARDILLLERTCLNFLGRLSGISTLTARFVQQIAQTSARVLDTRKTTPGWRYLEKFAVACGGGQNHRMGLFDAILIKDNHLALMDGLTDEPLAEIPAAIAAARQWIDEHAPELPAGRDTVVEIEVDREDQFQIAIACQPDIILLDNMPPDQLTAAVQWRNEHYPNVLLEASGGVDLESIGNIARTGVDRISVGALTHSAVNFDIGLDWQPAS